jgi:hypothetical protein
MVSSLVQSGFGFALFTLLSQKCLTQLRERLTTCRSLIRFSSCLGSFGSMPCANNAFAASRAFLACAKLKWSCFLGQVCGSAKM